MVTYKLRIKSMGDEYWVYWIEKVLNAGRGPVPCQRLPTLLDVAKYVKRVIPRADHSYVRSVLVELQRCGMHVIPEVNC